MKKLQEQKVKKIVDLENGSTTTITNVITDVRLDEHDMKSLKSVVLDYLFSLKDYGGTVEPDDSIDINVLYKFVNCLY